MLGIRMVKLASSKQIKVMIVKGIDCFNKFGRTTYGHACCGRYDKYERYSGRKS